MPQKILVIDDEPSVCDILQAILEQAGYQVTVATSGIEGLEKASQISPDLALVDIMMPVMDGWQVCRLLRQKADTPIIMLTSMGRESSVVKGLDIGADDYIVKPWSNNEMLARVQAVLRRAETPFSHPNNQEIYSAGKFCIDPHRRKVFIKGRQVKLAPAEFLLISYLVRRPNQVIPFYELITHVWGTKFDGDKSSLRVLVYHLRRKIEKDPKKPQYLLVKRGAGYYLADPEA